MFDYTDDASITPEGRARLGDKVGSTAERRRTLRQLCERIAELPRGRRGGPNC